MVVQQGWEKALYAFVFQVDAGIKVERYNGLFLHEKFLGFSKHFEAFGGHT